MKKHILSLVFVLATGVTFLNANQSDETKEIVEEFGCASDCVQAAKEGALLFSEDHEDRGEGSELMENYMMFYTSCYNANCS